MLNIATIVKIIFFIFFFFFFLYSGRVLCYPEAPTLNFTFSKCLLTVQRYGCFRTLTSLFAELCAQTALLLTHIKE